MATKIDWSKEIQSTGKAALILFSLGLVVVCASGFVTPTGMVRHEQACAAVAQYRKDTGTAGIKILVENPDAALTTTQTVNGETVGPWMSKTITGIEVKEDGTVLAPIGATKTPCGKKISIK